MSPEKPPVLSWSIFKGGAQDNSPARQSGTWEDLKKILKKVNPPAKLQDLSSAKKLVPAFSGATFKAGTVRGCENAEAINLLVFDFDNCIEEPIPGEFHLNKKTGLPTTRPKLRKIPIENPAPPEEVVEKLKAHGLDAVVWTTWSSSPALVKFRVVIPLLVPIDPNLWTAASEWAMDTLGLGTYRDRRAIDLPVLRDTARLNFLPAAPDPKTVRVWELTGKHLLIPEDALPTFEVRELVKQEWQKPRPKNDTPSGRDWWREYDIDFSTLDIEGLMGALGVHLGRPQAFKGGTKWRSHCLWPEEHSRQIDQDDAAVSKIPGEWPVFWCEHSCHRGVIGLREICETAGKDLVERFGSKYTRPAASSQSGPQDRREEWPDHEEVPPMPQPPAPLVNGPEDLTKKAQEIIKTHRGEGWPPAGRLAAIKEAVEFASSVPVSFHPFITPLFWEELLRGGLPLDPEVMQEHSLALHEKREAEKHEKETTRHLQEIAREVRALMEEGKVFEARTLLLEEAKVLHAKSLKSSRKPPRVALDELEALEVYLNKRRGRDRLGLTQDSMPLLDEALMGLRGLMLVAGPPGTGKTSLAFQLGLSAMETDPEAAVVLLSLEQSQMEHLTRSLAYFSGLPYKTVAMGSRPKPMAGHFTAFDGGALKKGEERLKGVGSRLLILDDLNFPDPTADSLFLEVEKLKEKTGATKVLVIVDYLQLWPLNPEAMKLIKTDLDRDKWQISELKRLKSLLGSGDAILVISEATKADWKTGLGMSSVMGSARGSYTPDVVMVLQPFMPEELAGGVEEDDEGNPKAKAKAEKKAKEEGQKLLEALSVLGRSLIHLQIVKGRDGVQRKAFDVVFHFDQLRFEESSLDEALRKANLK